jgi:hypothetical protein
MAPISRLNCLVATVLVAFMISGCQSPNSKWSTAWKERTKPKQKFQGVEGPEEVTYWPYKTSKENQKLSNVPDQFKDKLAKKSGQSKRESQIAELVREGDQLRKNGQFEDARLVYNKAIMISPDNAEIHHRLAIVADKQHQYTLADEHYQAALRLRPRDAKLLNDMGYSYLLRGDLQKAEITLKEALAIDKTHKIAMANLGTIYAQQNRYDDALDMFRNGTSEVEAQRYVAQLFSQNRSLAATGSMPNQGHSSTGPLASPKGDDGRDLSRMTQDQVQAEMARIAMESKQSRMQRDRQMAMQGRNAMAEDDRFQQQVAAIDPNMQQGGGSRSPIVMGPKNGDQSGFGNNQPGNGTPPSQQGMAMAPSTNGSGMPPNGNGNAAQVMNVPYVTQNNSPMNGFQNDPSVSSGTPDQGLAKSPNGAEIAKVFKGSGAVSQQNRTNEQQIQQAWDQQLVNNAMNTVQQPNGFNNASQMATQLGMSAGPGGMFPLMQGSNSDNPGIVNSSGFRENRFGAEMQRPLNDQSSQNWSGGSNDQTLNSGTANFGNESRSSSVAPMSPANNWSSPATGTLNWQNDSKSSSEWANETMSSNQSGNQINNQNYLSPQNQNSIRRIGAFDNLQPGLSTNQTRADNDVSRPYHGTWPNTNSLPQRQNANNSINGRSPETMQMMGINPGNDFGSPSTSGQNGSSSESSTNSLPMYPYAPNR